MKNLCLMELIDLQEQMINKQNELIVKLVNENAEQENMINVLMNPDLSQ